MKKNLMMIIVGPSGVGKSTLLDRLVEDHDFIEDIITCTTRPMRDGESEGNPYHFFTYKKFQELIDEGYFVEWAKVHTDLKGTPKNSIENVWNNNHVAIMDVDVQGAKHFMNIYPDESFAVFVLPPSVEELRKRIHARDGGSTHDLDARMYSAEVEISQADDFDAQIVNDDFEKAYTQLKELLKQALKDRES